MPTRYVLLFWSFDIEQAIKTTQPNIVNGIGKEYDSNVCSKIISVAFFTIQVWFAKVYPSGQVSKQLAQKYINGEIQPQQNPFSEQLLQLGTDFVQG